MKQMMELQETRNKLDGYSIAMAWVDPENINVIKSSNSKYKPVTKKTAVEKYRQTQAVLPNPVFDKYY